MCFFTVMLSPLYAVLKSVQQTSLWGLSPHEALAQETRQGSPRQNNRTCYKLFRLGVIVTVEGLILKGEREKEKKKEIGIGKLTRKEEREKRWIKERGKKKGRKGE